MAEIDEVKEQVAIGNRILAELGLATGITASLGHASMRLPSDPEHFVVKGRGYDIDALAKMRASDMVTCNLDAFKVDGPPGSSQPREVKMHSCIYKARPEVQSVVHIHPRYVVLMSVLEQPLMPICQEGIQMVREPLPVYPHVKTVWSDDEGTEVARLMGSAPAIILPGRPHGATTGPGTRLIRRLPPRHHGAPRRDRPARRGNRRGSWARRPHPAGPWRDRRTARLSETVLGMARLEEIARLNYRLPRRDPTTRASPTPSSKRCGPERLHAGYTPPLRRRGARRAGAREQTAFGPYSTLRSARSLHAPPLRRRAMRESGRPRTDGVWDYYARSAQLG